MTAETRRAVVVDKPDGSRADDFVAVEEPLEIRLGIELRGRRGQKSISITMRTPGHDAELAVGFLYGEGILTNASDIAEVRHCGDPDNGRANENVIRVELADGVRPDLARLQRNFYTTSSCGVCGKSSLEALDVSGNEPLDNDLRVDVSLVHELPGQLRESQEVFESTGGLHAAARFDVRGSLVAIREDVGRHNAMDKLVGAALLDGSLPFDESIVLLSGRASFELLQKALVARVPIVCAVGAPSSLAVDLAEQFGITLLGFVRNGRFNAYSHGWRLA